MSRTFGAVIIGDEILSGKRQDKHFARIAEMLGQRGLRLSWVEYLGDDRERLAATFRRTMAAGDVVFSCGGIGNTPDDHTRQAVAAALGVGLELHPEGLRNSRSASPARKSPISACNWSPSRPASGSSPTPSTAFPASWPTSTTLCRASRRWRIR
jgi:molybdopterin-biosynthesis enzyme MoeA-like protein